jgi:hypothetical protein
MCGNTASVMALHRSKLHETISCSFVMHAKRGKRMQRNQKSPLSS